MILTKDEAICLVLDLAHNGKIDSSTKLNKLLARLNLHLIPIDLDFELNRYGSFNAHLGNMQSNPYYVVSTYQYQNRDIPEFRITSEGKELAESVRKNKIDKILNKEEYDQLKQEIMELSQLRAADISENEHKILLVDTEDRHKLIQKVNTTAVDLLDIHEQINTVTDNSIAEIKLKALIEYCYQLSLYLKNRFEKVGENYDYSAYMFDYYFLYHISEIIPFIKTQLGTKNKNLQKINKYYQYLINSVSEERYPFSIKNPDLKKLMAQ